MSYFLISLGLFTAKTIIVFLFIAGLLILFVGLAAKNKSKNAGNLVIKNLNQEYADMADIILTETLPKKQLKAHLKAQEQARKTQLKDNSTPTNVFVLTFQGDMKASAVHGLSKEISAILKIAKPTDEVVLRLESAGGFVHGYGLAAAQLLRIRNQGIPLTITIDKIAASGGYLMACVGNQILSAPFAIIGSIGVLVQMPNFHRLLKDHRVDFVQLTAGEYKRTVTMLGENTEAGREKLKQEIEEVHQLFKNLIKSHRPHIDIEKVATGEHWLGQAAINLNLVDAIKTSDEYLQKRSKNAQLYAICYETKKPFFSKLTGSVSALQQKLLDSRWYQ